MFDKIDSVIRDWAKRSHLQLLTEYKDYEVRSVDVVDRFGNRCQVWIDPPEKDSVTVHVWPYSAPHEKCTVSVSELDSCLNSAHQRALELLLSKKK
jgi:hypothetical protein